MRKIPELVFIIPSYNEEKRIGTGAYFLQLSEHNQVSLLFVNDGSNDNTQQVLDSLASKIDGKVLRLTPNLGKAEAVRLGALQSLSEQSSQYIGFLDCDGAFPVDTVTDFIEKSIKILSSQNTVDAVISSRIKLAGRDVKRTASRHYISRVLITFIGFVIPELPYDSQSGLKIFRNTKELRDSLSKPFQTKWFFDIELLLRTGWIDKHRIWEEPVLAWRDVEGSHLNWKKIPALLGEIWIVIKLGWANRAK